MKTKNKHKYIYFTKYGFQLNKLKMLSASGETFCKIQNWSTRLYIFYNALTNYCKLWFLCLSIITWISFFIHVLLHIYFQKVYYLKWLNTHIIRYWMSSGHFTPIFFELKVTGYSIQLISIQVFNFI